MNRHCLLVLFLFTSMGILIAADSLVGKTESEILTKYGDPQSNMDFGSSKVLTYRDMVFELEDGKVVKASKTSAAPAPKAPAPAITPKTVAKTPQPTAPSQEGAEFDLKFTSLDGQSIDLKDYQGKVVLIDFWATWCGPCVASIPHLLEANKKYHGQGLEIIGVSLDSDKQKLTDFITKQKMSWPQYFDGKGWKNEISSANGINSIPSLWLIGKDGRLITKDARSDLDGSIQKALAQ